MLRDAPNVQSLWGGLLVEELVRCGVDTFVLCPGSRSTPLVQAAARNPDARCIVWGDERGAGFYALGHARSGGCAAVITTSGTAVANLLPAVVEASLDRIPLIVLTADRPHELREVGANQTIRQPGIFGDHVRWSFDLPAPDDRTPARMVLTTVDHAVSRALAESHPGPIHLNCPLREPLAPSEEAWDPACLDGLDAWLDGEDAFTWTAETMAPCPLGDEWLDDVATALASAESGLIVLGDLPHAFGHEWLGWQLGWPVWRDVRCGLIEQEHPPNLMPYVDRLLGHGFEPEVVLQFGSRPTSKRIQSWIDAGNAKQVVVVDPSPERIDPGHRVTHRFFAPADHWCDALTDALRKQEVQRELPADLLQAHERVAAALGAAVGEGDALTEPWVARTLVDELHPEHALFVSNSMPIRDVQAYAADVQGVSDVGANRGASGIDGIVSTAAGFADGAECPVTLLIGDMAMLHDVNALAFLTQQEMPVTIVVLNNGGGGIFSFLPIAEHTDVLTPYVDSAHNVHFEGVCLSFGIPYDLVEDRETFGEAYRSAIESGRTTLIEVASGLAENKAEHERIEAAIAAAVQGEATS